MDEMVLVTKAMKDMEDAANDIILLAEENGMWTGAEVLYDKNGVPHVHLYIVEPVSAGVEG